MEPNWPVVATIGSPIIALFVGAAIDRFIERKPKLIAYFTHASAFNLTGTNPVKIHTHGIIIKNIGKKPATDIRVRHNFLPRDFNVYPVVDYHVQNLPGGGAEIVFPTLVQNEQVSISYIYFPPILYSQIHAGIRHGDGFAKEVTALPTPQYPAWIRKLLMLLLLLGIIMLVYLIFYGCCSVYKIFSSLVKT
ncbi:MAG: hypothetical protein PHT32_02265 [Candidatus Omnitrophica bacterium]|nr:hypothetical protein [Candidatus Omnitrophota bacterium]